MKISFIGLGVMGKGMAMNLRAVKQEGIDYLVCDVNPEALKSFQEKDVNATTNIMDTVDSDFIFLCLPNLEAVQEVVLGDNGLLKNMSSGQAIVDFSTISYKGATTIAKECKSKGIEFLDCPISGQHKKSVEGTLSIMCGGNKEVFNEIEPYLLKMGSQVLYMGESGAGQLTKMINNCALNICVASFSELMPVGVKLGLDPDKLGDVLMTATGSSFASKVLIPKVLDGDFSHGFTLGKAYKDMESMYEVLVEHEIPLPTLNGTMQTYQLALQSGQRDYYKQAMIHFYEELLDVKVRSKNVKV